MNKKIIIILILLLGVIIAGVIVFSGKSDDPFDVNNVKIENGKQIIEIKAKGGYSPQESVAKSGLPTVLRIATSGTFDCSSSLVIPKMNYRKNLPPSGFTEIDIGQKESGSTLEGLCSMGMYNFSVRFE